MREILPGVWHWSVFYDAIGTNVHSHWIEPAGLLLDPMVPDDVGLDWWDGREAQPQQMVLTIGLHWRHSERFAERFGIPTRVPRPALGRYEGTERRAEPFDFGDEVAPGVTAIEIGAIAPDECALHIDHAGGLVAIADALIREPADAPLGFVPDGLMGDDPERVKAGLREALRGLLGREWDAMLLAHGDPVVGGAQQALRDFLAAAG